MKARSPRWTPEVTRRVTAAKALDSSTPDDGGKVPFHMSERFVRGLTTAMETLTQTLVVREDNLQTLIAALQRQLRETLTLRSSIMAKLATMRDYDQPVFSRRSVSRRQLDTALKACHGNVLQTARALGKQRRQIQRLMKCYGLDWRFFKAQPPGGDRSGQLPTSRPDPPADAQPRCEPDPDLSPPPDDNQSS
jgi:hypothetical protein